MKKRGFTLIEMLIVIVIIGILAGALIPRIGNARDKAQDVSIQANVNALTSAGMQALMDSRVPCDDTGDVQYTNLADYGMSNLNDANYHCRIVLDDHVIVWYTNMRVETNNNCSSTGINNMLTNADDIGDVLNVVGTTGSNEDVYCLAQ